MPDSKSPWFTPVDTGALPLTEPHAAPIFDTGPHPQPLPGVGVLDPPDASHDVHLDIADSAPIPVSVPSVVVPGQYLYVKWWKFLLLTFGVWAVAAVVGLGFYYWWFHSMDKTWTNFGVLAYVMVCMVGALLLSMVEQRPNVSVTAMAVMSAPFASGAAAAGLYGAYVFGWLTP